MKWKPTFCSGTRWWIGCRGRTGRNQSHSLLLSKCTSWLAKKIYAAKTARIASVVQCQSYWASLDREKLKVSHSFWAGLVGWIIRYMVGGGICLKGFRLLVRITHPLRAAPRPESQSRQGSLGAKPSYPSRCHFQRIYTKSTIERIEKESLTRIWSVKHQLEVAFKEGAWGGNFKIRPKLKVWKILMQCHWNAVRCTGMHHLCGYHWTQKESQWWMMRKAGILLPGRRDEFKWKEAAVSSILTRDTDPSTPHNFSNLREGDTIMSEVWKQLPIPRNSSHLDILT